MARARGSKSVSSGRKSATKQASPSADLLASAALDAGVARGGESSHIQELIERVGMINRIHSALRSTLNIEDLHTIILTTLVSQTALDLSRVILLGHDEQRDLIVGLSALGARDGDDHRRIQQEILEEEHALAGMVRDLHALEPRNEEKGFFDETLRELSNHSFWITTYQKFSANPGFAEAVRAIEIPAPDPRDAESGQGNQFLRHIFQYEKSVVVPARQVAGSDLPDELKAMLPSDTLWSVVRTQRGPRLIVIADKIFQDEPLNHTDELHVDWFIGQVSLALENAEMFHQLDSAFTRLREMDRMKSNFLATISHELRTPLTAITGYVQLMLGNKVGGVSAGQKEVLERILAHSELLTGKVNDLIEIAELDAGHFNAVELESVDPLNALMTVLPRVEQRRANKEMTIEPIVTEAIPMIRATEEALARIFFHLLDNAVKFGRQRGNVRVRFEPIGEDLHIRVEDDGIGISRNQLQNIFEAFYQIDNQLTRNYEGLGIGLAVIKKQLELTGGKIHVTSEPGGGSVFSVIYPLA